MPLTGRREEFVHAGHVREALLVRPEVRVIRVLDLAGLPYRRRDVVDAEAEPGQADEVRQQGVDVPFDRRRDRLPVVRAELMDMAAAVDLPEATDDGVAVGHPECPEIEPVAADAMHQFRADGMMDHSAHEVERAGKTWDPAAMAVADGVQRRAVAAAPTLPALPDEGEVPLLDVRLGEQPPQAVAPDGRPGDRLMEFDLQMDDVPDEARGDQMLQQGVFAAA